MSSYAVIVCDKCGGYSLAKMNQKTRTCPYCGAKITLEKARKVAVAKTAVEASNIIQRIKEKKAGKHAGKHAGTSVQRQL